MPQERTFRTIMALLLTALLLTSFILVYSYFYGPHHKLVGGILITLALVLIFIAIIFSCKADDLNTEKITVIVVIAGFLTLFIVNFLANKTYVIQSNTKYLLTDSEVKYYLNECRKTKYQFPEEYFERPEFDSEINQFIKQDHLVVILGANSIGKSTQLQNITNRYPYAFYFDLKWYNSEVQFNSKNPCTILSSLDLELLARNLREFLDIGVKEEVILIFDQADSLLQGQTKKGLLKRIVASLGVQARLTEAYRSIIVGSEGHILKNFFDKGGDQSRMSMYYASGFKYNQMCKLWASNTLKKKHYNQYRNFVDNSVLICDLLSDYPHLPTQDQIEGLNLPGSKQIIETLTLFRSLYELAGGAMQFYSTTTNKTETKIRKMYSFLITQNSVLKQLESRYFINQLVNLTKEDSMRKVPEEEFEQKLYDSIAARSNLVKIQEDRSRLYSFRAPYYRELAMNVTTTL